MVNMFVSTIVMATVGVILVASVFMPQLHGANVTGWSSGETSMWNTLGIFMIIGFSLALLGGFGIL